MDCVDPTCSDHGTCVNGKCYCKAGWQGTNCSALDKQVYQCLPSCSEHGTYDLETGSCKCQPFWTGSDCSKGKNINKAYNIAFIVSFIIRNNCFILLIQLFVLWIADPTADADRENASAQMVGRVKGVICYRVTVAVRSTDNVRTGHVCVRKDGMENTVQYVS